MVIYTRNQAKRDGFQQKEQFSCTSMLKSKQFQKCNFLSLQVSNKKIIATTTNEYNEQNT